MSMGREKLLPKVSRKESVYEVLDYLVFFKKIEVILDNFSAEYRLRSRM